MSRIFRSLLNNTFTVWQPQRSSDGQGGWLTTYASVGTVLGRMVPRGGSEADVADSEERQMSHVLYVQPGTVADQVARGWLVTLNDLTVEVQGVREPSLAGKHLEIDCRERQIGSSEVLVGS
jgi:head-tail adaptor